MGLSPGYIAAKNAAIQFETETLSEYGGAPYPVQNASSGASHWSQLVTVKGGFGGQAGQAIQTG